MKIAQIRIRNFLSFGEKGVTVNLSEFNFIVGPNASGKTNLLRALTYVGSSLKRASYGPDLEYYHAGDTNNPFEIEVGLVLDEDEIDALIDYVVCVPLNQAIQPKDKDERQDLGQRVAFEIAARIPRRVLSKLFRNISVIIRGLGKETDSPDKFIKLTTLGKGWYVDRSSNMVKGMEKKLTARSEYFGRLLLDAAISQNQNLKPQLTQAAFQTDKLAEVLVSIQYEKVLDAVMRNFDNGSIDIVAFGYIEPDGLERLLGPLPSVKRLRQFLRNRGSDERGVDFFSILNSMYNGSMIRLSELRSRPETYTVLPNNLDNMRHRMTEIVGTELSALLFGLLTSPNARDRERYTEIKRGFEDLTRMSFDLTFRSRSTSPQLARTEYNVKEVPIIVELPDYGENKEPSVKLGSDTYSHEVSIMIRDGQSWIPLAFSAAGIFEVLVLLATVIGQTRKVILLDEPALNLHPMKQVELRRILEQKASKNQLVLVTHSPLLIGMDRASDTWRFAREEGETRALHLGEELEYAGRVRKYFGGKLSDEKWGRILFANGVVLVEGIRDRVVVEELDRYKGKKGAKIQEDNWVVVDVGGKNGFSSFMDLGRKLKIEWVVLTDRDGIMECNSKPKGMQTAVPALFAYLIENGIMEDSDVEILQTSERSGNLYEERQFAKIQESAMKYSIFALPTDLEGAIGIADKGKRKQTRGVLEALDAIISNKSKVPDIFEKFFVFLRGKKTKTVREAL